MTIRFQIGDRVHEHDDPRHIGHVVAVFSSETIRVRWDNRWLSDVPAADLVKAERDD